MMVWGKWLKTAIVVLVIFDSTLVLGRARTVAAERSLRTAASPGAIVGLPRGYLADGRAFLDSEGARCTLVHYASRLCPYCGRERPVAATLYRSAAHEGCAVVALAPNPFGFEPGGTVAQLAFPLPDWVASVGGLRVEPTTILIGGDGRVIWQHAGEMADSDVAAALDRLRLHRPQ